MINDNSIAVIHRECIRFLFVNISHTESQETDYHIIGFNQNRRSGNTNAVTGSCLSGDGNCTFFDFQSTGKIDCAGYAKNDCFCARLVQHITQRTRSCLIFKRINVIDLSFSSAFVYIPPPSAPGKAGISCCCCGSSSPPFLQERRQRGRAKHNIKSFLIVIVVP